MEHQLDVNEMLDVLASRIAVLEKEKAVLMAQVKFLQSELEKSNADTES